MTFRVSSIISLCPICGDGNLQTVASQCRENLELTGGSYTYSKCTNCRVISQNPLPSLDLYLDAVVFLKDEADEYGNHGFIVQSVTKEEREKGVKGEILGNVKILGQQEQPQKAKVNDDGLPF